jgi:membrane-associated phospholipid phosphatase
LIPYLIFLLAGTIFLLTFSRTDGHLLINSYYNSFFDFIMPYVTFLGDGTLAGIIIFILLFVKYRYALLTGIAFLFVILFTQGLRQTIFHGWPRPSTYFKDIHSLHFVPGVELHSINTFPSGHTTTAFALYFCLAVMTKNNGLKFLLFLLSLAVAYSRVYLSQHFFADVYGSSILGICSAVIAYAIIQTFQKSWTEQSLFNLFKRS